MTLFDTIQNKQSCIPSVLAELKNQRIPLLLLGAGDRGRGVCLFLKKNGIRIDHVTVNKRYFSDRQALSLSKNEELPIECLEEVMEAYESVNLILGFSKYLLPKGFVQNDKINQIYSVNIGLTEGYNFTYDYYHANKEAFEQLYESLTDDLSRHLLIAHLNGRIQGTDADFEPSGWSDPQYFLPDLMQWNSYECLVDCGAYVGDTAEEFIGKMPADTVQNYKIYCFEPDPDNFNKLDSNFKNNANVIPLFSAVYQEKTMLSFCNGEGESSYISADGETRIPAEAIDNISADDKITFIKMDIEGSELSALKGAEQTIMRDRPRLAICLYHRADDLITIPRYIKELVPEYTFYLRTHSAMPSELVLYCIAP